MPEAIAGERDSARDISVGPNGIFVDDDVAGKFSVLNNTGLASLGRLRCASCPAGSGIN